eukprot:9172432-Pyramimonas_sp.AAC.1
MLDEAVPQHTKSGGPMRERDKSGTHGGNSGGDVERPHSWAIPGTEIKPIGVTQSRHRPLENLGQNLPLNFSNFPWNRDQLRDI